MNCHQGSLNAISISKTSSLLFLAAQNGVITAVTFPIMYQGIRKEFKMHDKSITKLCLTMDGSTLISCSEDGSICIWEVKDFTNKMIKTDNPYSDDVLISWSKLKSINKNITKAEREVITLKTKNIQTINKLKTEIDHELNENRNMKSINYKKAVDGVKDMDNMQCEAERKLRDEIVALKEIHELSIASLDAEYGEKLAYKYEKNSNREDELFAMITNSKKDLESLKDKLGKELQEAVNDYEEKIKERNNTISKVKGKLINEKDVLKMLVADIENDVNDNVSSEQYEFRFQLKKMKDLYTKSMSELVEHEMKYNAYSKTIADLTNQVEILENDVEKLKRSAANKSDAITNLEKSLRVNNDLIPTKDDRLQVVQDEMRELNKELSMLTTSIVRLEQATQPLILKIQEEKNLYEQNEVILDKELRALKQLELFFDELKMEKAAKEMEFEKLTEVIENEHEEINHILMDMRKTIEHNKRTIDDEIALKTFFTKYVGENAISKTGENEIEARLEFGRQRQYLERVIKDLKNSLKLLKTKNESHYSIMEENTKLIDEINVFRNEANKYLTDYNRLRGLLPKTDVENG